MSTKKWFYFLMVCSLVTGCKKDDFYNSILQIDGKLESYTSDNLRYVRFCKDPFTYDDVSIPYIEFGKSEISNDGKFNILSLATPTTDLLNRVDSIYGINLSVSDTSVRAVIGTLLIFNSGYDNSSYDNGWISKGYSLITGANVGSYWIEYIYVNKNVEINGTGVHTEHSNLLGIDILTTNNCNLKFKAGWNQYVKKVISKNGHDGICSLFMEEPPDAKWLFEITK
jgi:hypothetical protein